MGNPAGDSTVPSRGDGGPGRPGAFTTGGGRPVWDHPQDVPGGVLDQDGHELPGRVRGEPVVVSRTTRATTVGSGVGNRAESRCVR